MNELQVFDNPEFGLIRTLEENGAPLFCGNDVARALGYSRPADAITSHCKGSVIRRLPTNGGAQDIKFIPESDLYRLVFSSKLPTAEKFTDWVTTDVLPSIRKTGAYSMQPKSASEMFLMQAQLNIDQEKRIAALEARSDRQEAIKCRQKFHQFGENRLTFGRA